jgi:membrane glycosyltransferase
MKSLSLNPGHLSALMKRGCFVLLVALTIVLLSWRSAVMLEVNGWTLLKGISFALFVILLMPLALSFWTALIGFIIQWAGGDALDVSRTSATKDLSRLPLRRTAIVMPIYNEDPARVYAGLKATYESLKEARLPQHFDFYVLSDTTDPDIWVREELGFDALQKSVSAPQVWTYRNRRENTDRKTGNIADFCARWGKQYEYMIVFDADSFMTAASLANLVQLMEKHPQVGIIQAPPLPVNRRTLFGRLHQFAAHTYSSIFLTGLNFWQGGAGNYWGHNAIIRVQPFMEHCRLPKLPGKPPLGGPILSHDFVEAAFMRRAGWKVYLAGEVRGSYEEMPSSLIDYAARDRRWCQGNLQHSKLLFTPGLHLVSRVHITLGLMSYLSSPLWLLLLAFTTAEGLVENLGPHRYFDGKSLFPTWRVSVEHQAILLFAAMMGLLLLPKLLTVLLILRDRTRGPAFGSRLKLLFSVLLEVLCSTLLAPILALLQARFVIGILMGSTVKWDAQNRGESATTFREAIRRHWLSTLLGIGWAIMLLATVPKLIWWFSPVILGFILAIPLSVWSSGTKLGQWTKRMGLFVIPEELNPPPVMRALERELAKAEASPWAQQYDGLARVIHDSETRSLHLAMCSEAAGAEDELKQHQLKGLRLKAHRSGLESLTPQEKRALLLDSDFVRSFTTTHPPREEIAPQLASHAIHAA